MNLRATLIILAFLPELHACGVTSQTELKEWMREEAKNMHGKVPPVPEIKPFPAVAYEGRARLVPFSAQKILATELESAKSSPDINRSRQPLENFPLEDLRISGVIVRGGIPYAMVTPPFPNKPKHVSIGEFMGQHLGRIISITTDAVTILETAKDDGGEWVEREVIKPVPRSGGKQ